MNVIRLTFNKTDIRLIGKLYGCSIYEQQVKDKIDMAKSNIIVFPDNIEIISSSFTQGFFSELINIIGYDDLFKVVKISSIHQDMIEEMKEDILH